jgi:hypothetical protein
METKQPKWKQVGIIGDLNGGPVFVDETGVYPPELEYVQNMPEGDAYVYRFPMDNLKLSPDGKLIPANYDASWPHPIESYTEWFDKNLDRVASICGVSRQELLDSLLSDNPIERAWGYQALAEYHGWENFDSSPLHFESRAELEARYECGEG